MKKETLNIGVLTYSAPHRKTQDLLFALKMLGYDSVECIVLPWEQRKNSGPLIRHRPEVRLHIHPRTLCERLGYDYTEKVDLDRYDKILIGGAGILGPEFIKYEIINSHPGVLPYTRGLDALKWAIYEGFPIGVTTHVIDQEVDGGLMIDQRILNVEYFDTFHSVAWKLYQLEIEMLVDALTNDARTKIHDLHRCLIHRRMPHEQEIQMLNRFNKRKA